MDLYVGAEPSESKQEQALRGVSATISAISKANAGMLPAKQSLKPMQFLQKRLRRLRRLDFGHRINIIRLDIIGQRRRPIERRNIHDSNAESWHYAERRAQGCQGSAARPGKIGTKCNDDFIHREQTGYSKVNRAF